MQCHGVEDGVLAFIALPIFKVSVFREVSIGQRIRKNTGFRSNRCKQGCIAIMGLAYRSSLKGRRPQPYKAVPHNNCFQQKTVSYPASLGRVAADLGRKPGGGGEHLAPMSLDSCSRGIPPHWHEYSVLIR